MATNIKFHRITATSGSNIKTDQDYVKGDVYFIKSDTGNTGKVYICTVSGRGAAATLEDYSVDTNTWRPVENNLTSTSTDSSLSAAMGKSLNDSITSLNNSLPDLSNAVQITYAELKSLRDAGNLVPGQQYRITDYDFTTTQLNTTSAGHLFDIIVTADDKSTLNEVARAAHHPQYVTYTGAITLYKTDTKAYADEVDYDDYFTLAGTVEVDGVTYYRYDKYYPDGPELEGYILLESIDLDSLNVSLDNPLTPVGGGTYSRDGSYLRHEEDAIVDYENGSIAIDQDPLINRDIASWELKYTLDNVKYSNTYGGKGTILWMKDEFRNECNYDFINALFRVYEITACPKSPSLVGTYAIETGFNSNITYGTNSKFVSTFGSKCHDNIIRDDGLAWIVFGDNCDSNSFGNECSSNTFGNYCTGNTFEYNCDGNIFGNNCYYNTFGIACGYNTFGNDCDGNIFGNYDGYNTFGNDCDYNTFGNYYEYNDFGDNCDSNSFGNKCKYIRFITDTTASTKATYYQYNKIDSGVQYVNLYNADTASFNNQVQNYHIVAGVLGTSSNYINVPATRNLAYETKVAKNSAGELKIYCEADLIQ